MKNVSVLGSTGSIGKQTLEVAAANPDKIKIRALAAFIQVTFYWKNRLIFFSLILRRFLMRPLQSG